MPVQPSLIKQFLEIPEHALQDRHVDVFAVQVGVAVDWLPWLVSSTTSTTSPSGSMSYDERLHQPRLGDRGHEHGHVRAVLLVAIHVVAEAGAGHDFQVVRRTHGVGELEVAVAGDARWASSSFSLSCSKPLAGVAWRSSSKTFTKNCFRNPMGVSRACVGVVALRRCVGWGRGGVERLTFDGSWGNACEPGDFCTVTAGRAFAGPWVCTKLGYARAAK